MSEVKVNKISPRSGTNVQLGDSGDTITIPAGAFIIEAVKRIVANLTESILSTPPKRAT